MKRLVFLILAIALTVSAFAMKDFMVPSETKTALEARGTLTSNSLERDVPEFSFEIEPTALATTFYDYMPGSYCSLPLQILSDGSAYAAFHAQETAAVNRRVYYSFIEQGGNANTFTIGSTDQWEGYPGIAVDPETDDPFVAWHVNQDTSSATLEDVLSYDMYHISGAGYWKVPFVVISSDINTPFDDDEFIWPYVYIGPSPVDGKRRVYVTANNSVGHGPDGNPSENVLLAYADFDGADIASQSEFEWSYTTVETFDNWNAGNPDTRPFKSMHVSPVDGKIAYVGYNTSDELFVIYNENYGEGDWTTVTASAINPVENPENTFVDENGTPYSDMFFGHINDGHFNAVFSNDGTILRTAGAMGLQTSADTYYPYIIFPYVFSFNFETQEFSFRVLDAQMNENAANPEYVWQENEVYLPWDTDNDGEVDEHTEDGSVAFFSGWPIWYHDNDTAFHENSFYTAKGDDGQLAVVWFDGLNNKLAQDGQEGYEDWLEVVEICIATSSDNGATWNETIRLNNIDTPELEGIKPAYAYPGNKIETLADGHGRLHLMFLDDNSFGSFIQGNGNQDGGTLMYTALDIDFGEGDAEDNNIVEVAGIKASNYPNPFNPTTNISYNLPTAGDVTVEVYNTKGQVINTLVNEHQTAGDHSVVWNGNDSRGNGITSGVYFYKIKSGRFTSTKKMILLK